MNAYNTHVDSGREIGDVQKIIKLCDDINKVGKRITRLGSDPKEGTEPHLCKTTVK